MDSSLDGLVREKLRVRAIDWLGANFRPIDWDESNVKTLTAEFERVAEAALAQGSAGDAKQTVWCDCPKVMLCHCGTGYPHCEHCGNFLDSDGIERMLGRVAAARGDGSGAQQVSKEFSESDFKGQLFNLVTLRGATGLIFSKRMAVAEAMLKAFHEARVLAAAHPAQAKERE